MSANDRFRTTLAAVAFALAMLALGLLNPNADLGRTSCGLACGAPMTAPLGPWAAR